MWTILSVLLSTYLDEDPTPNQEDTEYANQMAERQASIYNARVISQARDINMYEWV